MSHSAQRFRNRNFSTSEFNASLSLKESLFEEGYEWDGRELREIAGLRKTATEDDLEAMRKLFWVKDVRGIEINKKIRALGLSKGGERILLEAVRDYRQMPLKEYVDKFHFSKKFEIWQIGEQEGITQSLLNCRYWTMSTTIEEEVNCLWRSGIHWIGDAIKFYKLIPLVWNQNRSVTSPYQVSLKQVALVAKNPGYKNLPLWAKVQIIKGGHGSSRPGDVWRTLMPALKAWKWQATFPKKIAYRVGEMDAYKRVIASIAWECCTWKGEGRKELEIDFWHQFRKLCENPERAIAIVLGLSKYSDNCIPTSYYHRNRYLEILWGLPHKFLNTEISDKEAISDSQAIELLQKYSDGVSGVCRILFGSAGKQVQKLFKAASYDQWKWASVLGYGNADLVQKHLSASECISYQEDTIEFLKHLGAKPALRMVTTTEMTIRGKIQKVTDDYIRDTGYLFNKLQADGVSPDLGRVRCWFSVHELLAKEYIKILPDFELRVNEDFRPLDGLSSLDMSWELEIPRHQHQLKRYGEVLSHCVGGYGAAINQGDSVIIAVYHSGVLKYTLEFVYRRNCYECRQFYGSRNSRPTDSDQSVILEMFRQSKLIN